MSPTIAFITSRKEPLLHWFFDSLALQLDEPVSVIVIDALKESRPENYYVERWFESGLIGELKSSVPKPTIWQGKHRITKEDWWAKSNAMNTAICLCKTEWIAIVDDRCVLTPKWLQCVRDAMEGNYAVCGRYEKRANLKVYNGEIVDYGELLGVDQRPEFTEAVPTRDWYGGSCAVPIEWCLQLNGFSEDLCDGLGSEDSMFGVTLRNSGLPMKYDARMKIIEDRTPGEAYEGALKRADKNPELGQRAKSWDIVRAFIGKTSSQNSFDIRDMRARILNGEDWRPPSASHLDWYDQQPISEMQ